MYLRTAQRYWRRASVAHGGNAAHGGCAAHRRRCLGAASTGERSSVGAFAPIVLATLLLGGCATSHIGSEWPCPASQGTPCTSVSAADPARAAPAAARSAGSGVAAGEVAAGGVAAGNHPKKSQRPPYRADENEGAVRVRDSDNRPGRSSGKCSGGCRPFAWLRRLVANDAAEAASDRRGEHVTENAEGSDSEAHAAEARLPPDLSPAGLPSARLPSAGPPSADLPPARLRTEEVVGRIWIAPYVDERDVYHEARWVRVVLHPARWRLR